MNSQRGFSIIEIMIATAIMAFMMVSVYTVVDDNTRTKDTVTSEDRAFMTVQGALARIGTDFNEIYSPLYYLARANEADAQAKANQAPYEASAQFPFATFTKQPVPLVEANDKSTLSFMSGSHQRRIEDAKQSRFAWVRYSLKNDDRDDSGDDGKVRGQNLLVRQISAENPFSSDIDWSKVREQVLLEGVKSLAFLYWNPKSKRYVESFNELDLEDRLAPRGLKVKITWIDPSGAEIEHERVFSVLWPTFDTIKDEQLRKPAPADQAGKENPPGDEGDGVIQ
jgi:prepilin-type N-terminal cleavage/methylation domain-containing protein